MLETDTTMKESVLFTAEKVEEKKDASEIEHPSNEDVNSEILSVSENEGALEQVEMGEEMEVVVNKDIKENGEKTLSTLEQEPSVHIIDMQIIKTSASNVEASDVEDSIYINDAQNDTVVDEEIQENEGNRIKKTYIVQLILMFYF